MRMGPLRAVDCIGRHFHPTQIVAASLGEVGGESIRRFCPLCSQIARLAEADELLNAGCGVDQEDTAVRMVGIAKDLRTSAIGRDVPGIGLRWPEIEDGGDFARGPIHFS